MNKGVWQLKKLVVAYCPHGGSSRGARAFVESRLPNFVADNPQVEVEVVKRGAKHPFVRGHYASGAIKSVCVKNVSDSDVFDNVMFLRNQKARKQVKLHSQTTLVPSTQGYWRSEVALIDSNNNNNTTPSATTNSQ